ncbi:putative membrane protein [Escovopsis weberi]|uniref:Putative membrane protein n=1 Tax=Escovopsis weberi TaxID=150374 RepID=A0A0M9VX83_ESCWE|nr:putative membrane protein [Escovopsis weberi]
MPPRLNIPPVTRVLIGALIFQSILSAAIRYRQWSKDANIVIPYLTLVPQLSVVYPWTFLTSSLVEGNIFTFGLGLVTLFHGGRYLERAWSSADLAKFLVIVCLIPNILTFFMMVLIFKMTEHEEWILTVIGGTIPIQISFLVAFSQLVPAHTVTLFRGVISMRVPRFPIMYMSIVALLSLTPILSRAALWLAVFGFQTSWTYLRFYKSAFPDLDSSQPASLRGDASETFAWAEFFPGPAKPFFAAVGDSVFSSLIALRLCTPLSHGDTARGGGGDGFPQRGAPGSARAEAERRRAIALKALDQRLQAATAGQANRPAVPPTQPTGPIVQAQPQPNTQTAMRSEPGQMLGETSLDADHEDEARSSG